jgi:hypothetical protein
MQIKKKILVELGANSFELLSTETNDPFFLKETFC